MEKTTIALAGTAAGAGLMYFLDPDRGRRRRALARDKAIHSVHRLECFASTLSRDLANRARGVVADARSLVRSDRSSDDVIAERIRSKLGRVVEHPHAIRVQVHGGRALLTGPILEREVEALARAVERVPGVASVEEALERHATPEGVPGLQGGTPRRPGRPGLFRAIARAIGLGRTTIPIQKTIDVGAPPRRVFDLLRDCESFPSFMTHVIDVRDAGDGRCHWRVRGPAGVRLELDTQVTREVPGELIAWKTLPGSSLRSAGMIRLAPSERGTRLDVRMTYSPPAGAIGHAVASLLGIDPKSALDDDLARFKSLIESGVTTASRGRVRLDEVHPPVGGSAL